MGDVWYQDNLEYLSDLLTPYPLPPPFYCIFGVYIFFTFWKSVGRGLHGLHGLKEATPLGGVQPFHRGEGGAIAYSLYPYQQCFRESAFLAFLTIYILSFISFSKVTLRPEYKFDKFALIDFCLASDTFDSRNSSVFFLILLFQAVYTIHVQINLNKI